MFVLFVTPLDNPQDLSQSTRSFGSCLGSLCRRFTSFLLSLWSCCAEVKALKLQPRGWIDNSKVFGTTRRLSVGYHPYLVTYHTYLVTYHTKVDLKPAPGSNYKICIVTVISTNDLIKCCWNWFWLFSNIVT